MSGRSGTGDSDGFEPHPEGGSYRPVWRSDVELPQATLPEGYLGSRSAGSCIAYRLAPGERSRWHRVRSSELWLWQGGGDLRLRLGGSGARPEEQRTVLLGPGGALQHAVGPNEWQAAEPAATRAVTVSCVVVPGFDWRDWQVLED